MSKPEFPIQQVTTKRLEALDRILESLERVPTEHLDFVFYYIEEDFKKHILIDEYPDNYSKGDRKICDEETGMWYWGSYE